MKKIIKLTERDLTRIVRRVIKEQEDNDDDDYTSYLMKNPDQIKALKFDINKPELFLIQGADRRTANHLLRQFFKEQEWKDRVRFISIIDCGGVDLSGIDFCECPDLVFVNLLGTPNNFEETQNDCYTIMSDDMYDFLNR